ncbi:Uncharacterised protein [Chlamydia trachomatis]|nr:Uncharacterised protein [Chlamydia trachomatis]
MSPTTCCLSSFIEGNLATASTSRPDKEALSILPARKTRESLCCLLKSNTCFAADTGSP